MSNRRSSAPIPRTPDEAILALALQVAELKQRVEALEARSTLPADVRVELTEAGVVQVRRQTTGNAAAISPPL